MAEPTPKNKNEWRVGRVGMLYRDLTPDDLKSRVVVSHIRLPFDGEVPDYVHYHKVDFQMIYCVKGRIKVVYEDQGGPFWLKPGDCVLQPPEIRHRVLEAEAGSEVIEVSSPAEHETWIDHDLTLPTNKIQSDRNFNEQRFVRHIASDADWKPSGNADILVRTTGISAATSELADVRILRAVSDGSLPPTKHEFVFYFVLNGKLKVRVVGDQEQEFTSGKGFVVPTGIKCDSRVTRKS
ncbi:MAG: cupin domain-containing protein, partial [Blastocatellia bacterium]